MKKSISKNRVSLLAIDLAKTSFQLHGIDEAGDTVLLKKISRSKLPLLVANLPQCLIVMEACAGSHYWARTFLTFGHEVKLIAPQFVKPFVKSNKNDAADAEAIAEAALRPNMRYVSVKTIDQQDQQAVHRIRSQAIRNRTALINQIRGILLEHGIQIPIGRSYVRPALLDVIENSENKLRPRLIYLLTDLYRELVFLDERVERYDVEIRKMLAESEDAQRLITIPGVGPQTATAVLCSIGNVNNFKNGRELAAFLGLVPRQHSTGGKPTLLGISKRGDIYLRSLFIHGARAVIRHAYKKTDSLSVWTQRIVNRRGKNVATVALANKMSRITYAILSKQQDYQLKN